MSIFRSLNGMVHIELVSADISGLLTLISKKSISIYALCSVDEITVRARILRSDYKKLNDLVQRRGDSISVIEREGIYWRGKRLAMRPVILTGFAVLLLVALILPSRVLFIRVQGNSAVPSKLILEMADDCGISIFASRRKVRSEKVKNALLEKIPELQWVGVNTAGCVATIRITEKTVSQQPDINMNRVSSIIASRDGVICEFNVLRGNAICQVGQAVKAGQTLVSGYTDCGIAIKATRAEAEIYARTLRQLQTVAPVISEKRDSRKEQKRKYSLLFGKKLIKLYKDSGISDASCVKIYDEIKLTLPGGFALPVSLICETVTEYSFRANSQAQEYEWLTVSAINYLQSQMVAGQILDQNIQIDIQEDVCCLSGQFACLEMIAQVKDEEILQR